MKKEIVIKDIKLFYKRIRLYNYLSRFGKRYVFSYKGESYQGSSIKHDDKINEVLKLLDIINTPKKRDKYSLLYDYTCDYLDNEFKRNNYCNFKNDVCESSRNLKNNVSCCCVRYTNNELCEHFDKDKKACSIKCITCKLYTCPYLNLKGIIYTPNTVPYLKYFLSWRQKRICQYNFFIEKDKIIDKWMKFYIL